MEYKLSEFDKTVKAILETKGYSYTIYNRQTEWEDWYDTFVHNLSEDALEMLKTILSECGIKYSVYNLRNGYGITYYTCTLGMGAKIIDFISCKVNRI